MFSVVYVFFFSFKEFFSRLKKLEPCKLSSIVLFVFALFSWVFFLLLLRSPSFSFISGNVFRSLSPPALISWPVVFCSFVFLIRRCGGEENYERHLCSSTETKGRNPLPGLIRDLWKCQGRQKIIALWSRINKNPDKRTKPLAHLFACLLWPLTRLLAPPCSLCLHAPLLSLVCWLIRFTHSLARGKVND